MKTLKKLPRKVPTTPERSRIMSKIPGSGNKSTELALIKVFRKHHIVGWRRRWPLPGNPDFVFPKYRIAIFVDGCFWHGCPNCYREPRTNTRFWRTKINNNRIRDKRNAGALRRLSWKVIRIWEHRLKPKFQMCVARRIIKIFSACEKDPVIS